MDLTLVVVVKLKRLSDFVLFKIKNDFIFTQELHNKILI